jgi:hypothetical protein
MTRVAATGGRPSSTTSRRASLRTRRARWPTGANEISVIPRR